MIRSTLKHSLESTATTFVWFGRLVNNALHHNLGSKGSTLELKKHDAIVILCNGPSLSDTLKQEIKYDKYDFMCVNFFPSNSDMFYTIKPKYICIIDDGCMDSELPEMSKKMHQVSLALEAVDWPMYFFLYPFQDVEIHSSIIKKYKVNANTHDSFSFSRFLKKLYDRNLAIPICMNVSVFAIYNAIRMGYKKIYVAGLDMSFHTSIHVDGENNIFSTDKHFYGEEELDLTHNPYQRVGANMTSLFRDWYYSFAGLSLMKEYAEAHGIDIINLAKNSFVDIFKKGKMNKSDN